MLQSNTYITKLVHEVSNNLMRKAHLFVHWNIKTLSVFSFILLNDFTKELCRTFFAKKIVNIHY